MYLSKSDFKVARTCPTKLYYKKLRYPSLLDQDPFMKFLADGGYMVEKMAKLLFPDGIEMEGFAGHEDAFEAVRERLEEDEVTLFEPTIMAGNLLARVDILEKKGSVVRLIEVKSTSVDTVAGGPNPFRGKQGGIISTKRPYLEDVTFQALVFKRAFPELEIQPVLCVVDKSKAASEDCTCDRFRLTREGGGRMSTDVEFLGDVDSLREAHLLALIDVAGEVGELAAEVEAAADELAASVAGETAERLEPALGMLCKKCEYRTDLDGERCGFAECWGELAHAEPHLLDFCRLDGLRPPEKGADPVSLLTGEGKGGLLDVPEGWLKGAYASRQRIQLGYTSPPREFLDDALRDELRTHAYPLHFIDFEASRVALPYHAGMRPYQQTSFQWSCHTISKPGADVEHFEWINVGPDFPNLEFARTLREVIGDEGTVYTWSSFEQAALREIRTHMDRLGVDDPGLAEWLDSLGSPERDRVVDMEKLVRKYHFHPRMGGRTSIKCVLPAVWENDESLWTHPLFSKYHRRDDKGMVMDPYKTLEALPVDDSAEDAGIVQEGTAAIRAYQDLVFGRGAENEKAREQLKQLLLQYCELDTAAMVMIWMHWQTVA